MGDSLIQHLRTTDIWKKKLVPLHAKLFGLGGDQTQNVLWRMLNGELDNVSPKVLSQSTDRKLLRYKK